MKDRYLPYLLILPSVLFLLVFFGWPLLSALVLAFREGEGVGLGNFRRMAQDLYFGDALRNTLLLTAIVVPLQLALALAMGLLLERLGRGRDSSSRMRSPWVGKSGHGARAGPLTTRAAARKRVSLPN